MKKQGQFFLIIMLSFGNLLGCQGSKGGDDPQETPSSQPHLERPEAKEEGPSQLGLMAVWVGPHLYRVKRVVRQATDAGGRFGLAVVLDPTQGASHVSRKSQLVFQLTIGLKDEVATGFLQWALPGEVVHLANAHYASMGQLCKTQVQFGLDGAIHGQVVCPQLDCTTGNGWFFKTMCPYGKGVALKAHFTGLR